MAGFTKTQPSGAGSKSARARAGFAAALFSPRFAESSMRSTQDFQACIRSQLRRRRRALGLTQEQAAGILGIKRLTYHRIETGARRIHFADLAALCELYSCDPAELLQDSQLAAAYARAAAALVGEASA